MQRSIVVLMVVLLLQVICPIAAAEDGKCETGHRTRFEILDCDREPVSSVDVTITLCCVEEVKKGITNEKGQITFPYYFKEICARSIFGQAVGKGLEGCLEPPDEEGKTFCRMILVICSD